MKKILIIDDSITFKNGLKRIIEGILPECRIYEASDGKEAFHLLTEQSFDHIFTDLEMDGGDGRQFLQKLTCNRVLSKKKVTVVSSSITTELKETFKDNINVTFVDKSTTAIMTDKITHLLK